MTTRTFAPWVEPVATQLREGRSEIVRTARGLLPEHWSMPSALPGWTYRDLLAHLAGDTGKGSLEVMRAAADHRALDPRDFLEGADALNARDVEQRRDRSVDELIAEIEADGAQWQDLLSHLREGDGEMRWSGFPMSLGEYLRILVPHDREHLAQLKSALDNVML